jgi:hypothetical protein
MDTRHVMSIIELKPIRERRLRLAESRYQSKHYSCLDVVDFENWIHRWRCVEVERNSEDGSISVWQFKFDSNKLEFQHYHRAVRSCREDVSSKLLWKGLEVVEQFPAGYEGTSHIDLDDVTVPNDIAVEAKRIFLEQLARHMKVVYPDQS